MTLRTSILMASTAVAALALAGCSAPAQPADSEGKLLIVASTSVYGSIAEAIGGDLVSVTSLISNPSQDPHSYEASAQDQLTLSKADLVIENGGGYDPFIDTLLSAANSTAVVVNAVDASELLDEDHAHEGEDDADHADEDTTDSDDQHSDDDGHDHIEGFNEHVWYNFHAVGHVAEQIADDLSDLDEANAATYEANYAAFEAQIETLEATAATIATGTAGAGVAITEPVALYLLEAVGLTNETPASFSEAIEEGTDVPPAALQQTLDLFTESRVILLGYNEQTASPETETVRVAAEQAGIPVVSFTETLPDGTDYVSWMTGNLDALVAALP